MTKSVDVGRVVVSVAVVFLVSGCTLTTTPAGPGVQEVKGGIASAAPQPKPTALAVSCPGGSTTLSSSNSLYRLADNCVVVRITGSSITASADAVTMLTISGDFEEITAKSVVKLNITGNSDAVSSGAIGSVRINGYNNTVTSSHKIASVAQSGSGNKISAGG